MCQNTYLFTVVLTYRGPSRSELRQLPLLAPLIASTLRSAFTLWFVPRYSCCRSCLQPPVSPILWTHTVALHLRVVAASPKRQLQLIANCRCCVLSCDCAVPHLCHPCLCAPDAVARITSNSSALHSLSETKLNVVLIAFLRLHVFAATTTR